MPNRRSDQNYLRNKLIDLGDRYGPDAVRATLDAIEAEDRPETAPAIRGHLLGDLAHYPPAFQRRLRPEVEWETDPERPGGMLMVRTSLRWFEISRERAETGEDPSCGCECHGINAELAGRLKGIRQAAAEVRAQRARGAQRFVVQRRRAALQGTKTDFLKWLWLSGNRGIDRRQLAQHAVEWAKAEAEHFWAQRRGERDAADHARVERLLRLVASDVPRLVREYTGCDRQGVA